MTSCTFVLGYKVRNRYALSVTHFIPRPLRSYAVTHFIPDRHYWQATDLRLPHKSRVRVLTGQHCVVALGIYLHLCSSVTEQCNWVWSKGVISLSGKVTTGLMERGTSTTGPKYDWSEMIQLTLIRSDARPSVLCCISDMMQSMCDVSQSLYVQLHKE